MVNPVGISQGAAYPPAKKRAQDITSSLPQEAEHSYGVNSKIALLFPGQGSQVPGMGKSLYENFLEAREIFDQANDAMGYDITNKIFNGSEDELRQTILTQPAIFTVSCAAFKVFSSRIPHLASRCSFSAGHSLGEYSALYASEVFDFQTGLKFVEYRAEFIHECCEKSPGTMAAVIGAEKTELKKLCDEIASNEECCEMVNFNSPGQIVVAGTKNGMKMVLAKLSALDGCKGIPLNVSGAFHSSLMQEASEKMEKVLESASFRNAKIPVITNCDAQSTSEANAIKEKCARQINHPVLWEECIQKMIAEGVETFIEVGPGKILSGILRKIDKKKKALNVEDPESLAKTLSALSLNSQ